MLIPGDAKFWYDFGHHFEVIMQSSVPVICLPHEMEGFDNDRNVLHLHALAIEGRLSVLTLVEHASDDVRRALKKWQQEDPAWAAVAVGTFTPVSCSDGRAAWLEHARHRSDGRCSCSRTRFAPRRSISKCPTRRPFSGG